MGTGWSAQRRMGATDPGTLSKAKLLWRVLYPSEPGTGSQLSHQGASSYRLSQLRYDLRKLRAHRLIERTPKSYAYRTTVAGQKQIILLLQISKRIYGPLAHSALVRRPDPSQMPNSKFERAYLKVDKAIDEVVELLAA